MRDCSWYAVRSDGNLIRDDAWRLAAAVVQPRRGAVLVRVAAGKPQLRPPDPYFSVAHHRGRARPGGVEPSVAVVAVSARPVGVDVLGPVRFSSALRDALAHLVGEPAAVVRELDDAACTRLWCRVEALVKLDGGSLLAEFAAAENSRVLRRPRRDGALVVDWSERAGAVTVTMAVAGADVPSGPPVWVDRQDLPRQLPAWLRTRDVTGPAV